MTITDYRTNKLQQTLDALSEALREDGPEGYEAVKQALLKDNPRLVELLTSVPQEDEQAENDLADLFLEFHDLGQLPKPEWLIYSVLPAHGINFIYGKQGCKKTFVATDIACHIALENGYWMGRKTKHGHVVYIAGEDVDEVGKRIQAWAKYHRVNNLPHLHVFRCPLDLAKDTPKFIEALDRRYGDIDVAAFVVDTLAVCSLGIDENSKREFDAVLRSLEALWRKYNCCVLPVHHSGNNGDMRGTSAMDGIAYSMIEVSAIDEQVKLHSYKPPRSSKAFDDIYLNCQDVETGQVDEMGFPETTLVLTYADRQTAADATRLTKLQHEILQHIHNFGGVDVPRATIMQACQLKRDQQSVLTNAVSELLRRELISSKKQGRFLYFTLTEKGRSLLEQ